MTAVSFQITNLLEKMNSNDKDFRFMATNDLMGELQKDSIKLDDVAEKRVVRMLLKLLEDKNGEVQNLAVKCLGPLVSKVKEWHIETVLDTLCQNMVAEKEELRDISSIGLKTVIAELPSSGSNFPTMICKKIIARLASTNELREDVTVQLEILDILSDLLSRFGPQLAHSHEAILTVLLPQLSSPRLALRKRGIICIGRLVASCTLPLYRKLMESLVHELAKGANKKTTIQCLGAVSRHSGHRFGSYLDSVVPFVMKFSQAEDDDELREFCLEAFENFVRKCPKEISKHIDRITDLCLVSLCYDPNYNEDHDEGGGSSDGMETDEDDQDGVEESDDEEYSDDDDISWKVRRAAAKCLEAVIATRPELIQGFYVKIAPKLIARFKEREENVKTDIFHTFLALLKQTRPFVHETGKTQSSEGTPGFLLNELVPSIVKAMKKLLRDKSLKTRQGCFSVLSELVNVLPGSLSSHASQLVPGVIYSLSDRSATSSIKLDALSFLHAFLSSHPPQVFHPFVDSLVPFVLRSISDSFYKITTEALMVTQRLAVIMRPGVNQSSDPLDHLETEGFNFEPYVQPLYEATLVRLRATDIDQEVKERAILCMGDILAQFADRLQSQLPVCLPIFLDRLKNEITRLTAVKAMTRVASSSLKIDLSSILLESLLILASFLRKNQRSLKIATLVLLETLSSQYPDSFPEELMKKILSELPPLVSESDLHVAQLTLSFLTSVAKHQQRTLPHLQAESAVLLDELFKIIQSALLQGSCLSALLGFFQAAVQAEWPGITFQELYPMMIQELRKNPSALHRQAFHSYAKCVSAITFTQSQPIKEKVVAQLLRDTASPPNDFVQLFSLVSVGEIGKGMDLSQADSLKPVLMNVLASASSEDVKAGASYALGSVALGNLEVFVPFLLEQIGSAPSKQQYALLHSLKEVIVAEASAHTNRLTGYIPTIWELLFQRAECAEEGTRNVVAECLGKLTLMSPAELLPKLQVALKSQSPVVRSVVLTAFKFTISDQAQPIDSLLHNYVGDFLEHLSDTDLAVCRVALVALNSIAHNKPGLIKARLPSILPALYAHTEVKEDLIREVEMGPFKHYIDDGLDLRKSAFEVMFALLETSLDRLDIFQFLVHVEAGLKDHYDIKMLVYLMLLRLAQLVPNALLERLDAVLEPIKATCVSRVKANAVGPEREKHGELTKCALRAVQALKAIPDADKNIKMVEFMDVVKTEGLQSIWNELKAAPTTSSTDTMDTS